MQLRETHAPLHATHPARHSPLHPHPPLQLRERRAGANPRCLVAFFPLEAGEQSRVPLSKLSPLDPQVCARALASAEAAAAGGGRGAEQNGLLARALRAAQVRGTLPAL